MLERSNAYQTAHDFLVEYLDSHPKPSALSGKEIVDRELKASAYTGGKPSSLKAVNRRFILSLQNRERMARVIGWNTSQRLKSLLFGFDCHQIRKHYGDDHERLLDDIRDELPDKRVRQPRPGSNARTLWETYARGILSCAAFLSQFRDFTAFDDFVTSYTVDPNRVVELPKLIAGQVEGFGFALACDFLKECGYTAYSKPDVHVIAILNGIGLLKIKGDGLSAQCAAFDVVADIARAAGVTPVIADKVLWMIGSGKFNENGFEIPPLKNDFIQRFRG